MILVRPLVAGSRCYILTFPSPVDILLAGVNSGKLEVVLKLDLYFPDLTHSAHIGYNG